jgi:hypothetical protein
MRFSRPRYGNIWLVGGAMLCQSFLRPGFVDEIRLSIMSKIGGIVGVSDHGGWAVLVTVARDGTLLDRHRVEPVDEGLPKVPHHYEGQGFPLDEGIASHKPLRGSRILVRNNSRYVA